MRSPLADFWVTGYARYGYRKKKDVQDGAKKRAKLALNPPDDGLVRRMSGTAASGMSLLGTRRFATRRCWGGLPASNWSTGSRPRQLPLRDLCRGARAR